MNAGQDREELGHFLFIPGAGGLVAKDGVRLLQDGDALGRDGVASAGLTEADNGLRAQALRRQGEVRRAQDRRQEEARRGRPWEQGGTSPWCLRCP